MNGKKNKNTWSRAHSFAFTIYDILWWCVQIHEWQVNNHCYTCKVLGSYLHLTPCWVIFRLVFNFRKINESLIVAIDLFSLSIRRKYQSYILEFQTRHWITYIEWFIYFYRIIHLISSKIVLLQKHFNFLSQI